MLGWTIAFSLREGRFLRWSALGNLGHHLLKGLEFPLGTKAVYTEFSPEESFLMRDRLGKFSPLSEEEKSIPPAINFYNESRKLWYRIYSFTPQGPVYFDIDPHHYQVTRVLLSYLRLVLLGGLLPHWFQGRLAILHGGLLVRDGKGILVTGPSGMGKSTLCRTVSAPWEALADDMVLCYRSGSSFFARPFPTWSLWNNPALTPRSFPTEREVELKRVVLLSRGNAGIHPITPDKLTLPLTQAFNFFLPYWPLPKGLSFLRKDLCKATFPFAMDCALHLPGFVFTRNLEDDPLPWLEKIFREG